MTMLWKKLPPTFVGSWPDVVSDHRSNESPFHLLPLPLLSPIPHPPIPPSPSSPHPPHPSTAPPSRQVGQVRPAGPRLGEGAHFAGRRRQGPRTAGSGSFAMPWVSALRGNMASLVPPPLPLFNLVFALPPSWFPHPIYCRDVSAAGSTTSVRRSLPWTPTRSSSASSAIRYHQVSGSLGSPRATRCRHPSFPSSQCFLSTGRPFSPCGAVRSPAILWRQARVRGGRRQRRPI